MNNNITIKFSHTPVLLQECLDGLSINPNGTYVDCTLGGAGHSLEIVKKLTKGKLIAIDKDIEALNFSKQKLQKFNDKVLFIKSDFKNLKNILLEHGITNVNGILADLGVSSHQIDTKERGFSYVNDGLLDMRMDETNELSAYDVVNYYNEQELSNIIFKYGEESFARKIARSIVEYRVNKKIETTLELSNIISQAIPKKFHGKGNVSKKTFQAIRIEVNTELKGLDSAIKDMINALDKGGRLAIITFHSLEDRIVKNVFKEESTDCLCDKSVPICICKHKASIKLINKKPITATEYELKENKRSASAKLRVIEKI